MRFRDAPFKTKLTLLSVASSMIALILAGGFWAVMDWVDQKKAIDRNLSILSDVIGNNSTASLVFDDPKSAMKTLGGLRNEKDVLAAVLYDQFGNDFVTYRKPGFSDPLPAHLASYGRTRIGDTMFSATPIYLEKERVGSLAFVYDLSRLKRTLATDLEVIAGILAFCFLISLYFSSRLKRLTSEPILHLAEVARRVATERNYSFRATKAGNDELGLLIDDFNTMLAEIQRRTDQAEAAIRLRDEFISIAAHELRTPLTTLGLQYNEIFRLAQNGSIHRLSEEDLLKRKKIADRQFDRFTKLVDELLDVSRISTGQLKLDFHRMDLSSFVREITGELGDQIARAGCTLELHLEPGLIGNWDQRRISQVISNLILNATKYGAGKPIIVRTEYRHGFAVFSVKDFGIGIAKADQGRVFGRFERAVSLRNFGGFGLGLYIARQNVSAHGGEIWVDSTIGSGSTFTFTLPLSATSKKPRAA